jgi:hypothetical protein
VTDPGSEPDLPRAARRLGWLFAGQILAMLLIVIGGVLLIVTAAHNNSPSCPPGPGQYGAAVGCTHRSYALPIGLLVGGFAWFLIGMAVTAAIGLRAGASVLDTLLKRRR